MTNIQIENAISGKLLDSQIATIHFRSRNAFNGLFIKSKDFDELKSKNLWRMVSHVHLEEYQKTKDNNLSRIFNGVDFTRIVSK